jgi:hypothetical protein
VPHPGVVTAALRYGDREVVVGELTHEADPNLVDLCLEHAQRMTRRSAGESCGSASGGRPKGRGGPAFGLPRSGSARRARGDGSDAAAAYVAPALQGDAK